MLSLQQMAALFMGILGCGIVLAIIGMLTPTECARPHIRTRVRKIVVFKHDGGRVYYVDAKGHRTAAGYTGRYWR